MCIVVCIIKLNLHPHFLVKTLNVYYCYLRNDQLPSSCKINISLMNLISTHQYAYTVIRIKKTIRKE